MGGAGYWGDQRSPSELPKRWWGQGVSRSKTLVHVRASKGESMGAVDYWETRGMSASYSCVCVHACVSETVPATGAGLWPWGPYVEVPEAGETGIQGHVLD